MDLLCLHLHQPNTLPSLRRLRNRATAVAVAAAASQQTSHGQIHAERSVLRSQQCAIFDDPLRQQRVAFDQLASERGVVFVGRVEVKAEGIGGLGVLEVWSVYGA